MEDNKGTQVVENVEKETTEKTYTEQDIQNSFNAGVKKANSDWQKDEKYKEFLDWKKTNQNDSEKLKELETNDVNQKNEIRDLKAQLILKDYDVKSDFIKFVKSEVLNLTDDANDFETALKKYKKENPQYFGEVQIKKVQSSPTLVGGNQPQTINDIMNNFIRNN